MFEAEELPSWRFIDARSPQFSLPAINHGACSGLWERSPHNLSQETNLLVRSAQRLITGTKLPPKMCYQLRIYDLPSFNTNQQFLLLENNWASWQKWCLHNLHVSPWQTFTFLRKRALRNRIKIGFVMKDHSYIIYFSINRGSQSMGSLHEKWGCNVQTSFTRHAIHKQRRLRFKIWRGKKISANLKVWRKTTTEQTWKMKTTYIIPLLWSILQLHNHTCDAL